MGGVGVRVGGTGVRVGRSVLVGFFVGCSIAIGVRVGRSVVVGFGG
jgi:hypothetical protein